MRTFSFAQTHVIVPAMQAEKVPAQTGIAAQPGDCFEIVEVLTPARSRGLIMKVLTRGEIIQFFAETGKVNGNKGAWYYQLHGACKLISMYS